MSKVLHIVLDNNLSEPFVRELRPYLYSDFPKWTVRHETDVAKESSPDSHWITQLHKIEKTGDWVIFTSDEGKNTKKESEKLPLICKHNNTAFVITSQTMAKVVHLRAAMPLIWSQLPDVVEACRLLKHVKTHVSLVPFTHKKARQGYRLQVRGKPLSEFLAENKAKKKAHADSHGKKRKDTQGELWPEGGQA